MTHELISRDEISTFLDDEWIDEVLFPVKSGKEATVYCCKAHPRRGTDYYALKVYKPREQRNFRNDAAYREGRVIGDARMARAVQKKSRRGQAFLFGSWIGHEFDTLGMLHSAGADVPRPFAVSGRAMIIEFVGDGASPAPQLARVQLTPAKAELLLEQALRNIEIMLACHVVHGDLSAYNMLVVEDRLAIIDMPQAVDARSNRNARDLLVRDVARVCDYFASQGADAEPGNFAGELWELYERAQL